MHPRQSQLPSRERKTSHRTMGYALSQRYHSVFSSHTIGFGFNNRNHSPEVVRSIANFFRSSTPGGAYLMAGVPGHWRTSTSDSDRNPEFLRVWTEEFDALSPWTVGRYGSEEDAERWGKEKVKPDFDLLK